MRSASGSERGVRERDILWLGCYSGNHPWRLIGGRNAGCSRGVNDCICSVPVHECTRCGACDYGDNAEADQVRAECDCVPPRTATPG
jgi:hypothetical protein